ncbi:MAG: tRNA pseudouridine(55) synthase TruB [Gemmataceae bacterium]
MAEGLNGFLVVDKPGGMTSRDVVNRIQRILPRRTKIGHTGTLDPLATGVLVLCIGSATKLADRVQAMGKSYLARIRLGATSDTDDRDGIVSVTPNPVPPALESIQAALRAFTGTIQQTPPNYSAVKVGGRRAHDLARAGRTLELTSRPVTVYRIEIRGYTWPDLDLEIDCSKGTYIRSIARDLGQALEVGGLIDSLRRTKVGHFFAEQGVGIDVDEELIRRSLRSVDELG